MDVNENDEQLGGRLPLLYEEDLGPDQRAVRDRLMATQVPEAERSGFVAQTSDGRFVGPFNAYIRFAGPGGALLDWAAAQVRTGALSESARQVVTLAVGAVWTAPFELQAHVAGARAAGVSKDAIAAVVAGSDHPDLDAEAQAARNLAAALLDEHRVGDSLYRETVAVLGEDGVAAVAHLIGQYVAVSALLIAFDIPAVPADNPEEEPCRS